MYPFLNCYCNLLLTLPSNLILNSEKKNFLILVTIQYVLYKFKPSHLVCKPKCYNFWFILTITLGWGAMMWGKMEFSRNLSLKNRPPTSTPNFMALVRGRDSNRMLMAEHSSSIMVVKAPSGPVISVKIMALKNK